MLEQLQNVWNVYLFFLDKGINIIAIILTIIFVDKFKTLITPINLNNKFKTLLNIGAGLVSSFVISLLFFIPNFNIFNILKCGIIGSILSVYSHEIVKAIYKVLPGKQEGEDD
jgi:hypothetical protein